MDRLVRSGTRADIQDSLRIAERAVDLRCDHRIGLAVAAVGAADCAVVDVPRAAIASSYPTYGPALLRGSRLRFSYSYSRC